MSTILNEELDESCKFSKKTTDASTQTEKIRTKTAKVPTNKMNHVYHYHHHFHHHYHHRDYKATTKTKPNKGIIAQTALLNLTSYNNVRGILSQ